MRRIHLLALAICLAMCLGASDCADDSSPQAAAQLQDSEVVAQPRGDTGPVSAMPEPSAALVFAAGLAIAYLATRRSQP